MPSDQQSFASSETITVLMITMSPPGVQPEQKVGSNVAKTPPRERDRYGHDLRDQILRVEADIELLAKTLEGCRKAMLLSKLAIAAGGLWILAYVVGAIRFDAAAMIAAMAAVMGGIVVFGSNLTTSKQTTIAVGAAERRRTELIDMLNLPVAGVGQQGERR